MNYPFSFILLPEFLVREGEYLVLGDFNLYHLLWSSSKNPATHLVTNLVIEILLVKDIELTISREIVI